MSVIYLIIANEDKIRECTTDRNGYIENILKNVNKPIELTDTKITENNSNCEDVNCIVDDKPNLEECRNIENQEIKDCDTIQYYTHDDMNKIIQAAISAGDGRLVRACMKATCAFTFNDFDNDLIPFQYHKDVSNYKIMNVVNIKKPKQKRTRQSIKK
jgi:hypothetical protein